MEIIRYSNWILLGLYFVFCVYGLSGIGSAGMDAAGRGMSQGFALVGLFIVLVLLGLNLINANWLRLIIFVVCLWPLFLTLRNHLRLLYIDSLGIESFEDGFSDPQLKALVQAVDKMNADEVQALLAADPSNINQIGLNKETLLGIAVSKALNYYDTEVSMSIVNLLLENGADPSLHSPENTPPLLMGVTNSSFQVFSALLKAGADPDAKNQYGIAALYFLIDDYHKDHYDKIELLLQTYKADPNILFGYESSAEQWSALTKAASHKQWNICSLLIESGANIHFTPPSGDLTFWLYYDLAKAKYQEEGTTPENFQALSSLVERMRTG